MLLLLLVSHLIYIIRYGWQWHIKYIHSFQQYVSSFTRHILLPRVHIADMSLSSITYTYVCMHIYIYIHIWSFVLHGHIRRHQITDKSTVCSTACKDQNKRTHQSSALLAFWSVSIARFPSQRASNTESISISWHHVLQVSRSFEPDWLVKAYKDSTERFTMKNPDFVGAKNVITAIR